jgi:uncharacterized membrane protein YoaK (UPF0700 family)
MNSTRVNLLQLLPYAGALPFAGAAALLVLKVQHVPLFGTVRTVVLSYGLLIISFMAGVHWGQYLEGVRAKVNMLVSSIVVALAAWFGFLLLPAFWFCLLLIFLFAVLYLIDTQLHAPSDYLKTRRNVTVVVCFSLLVTAYA